MRIDVRLATADFHHGFDRKGTIHEELSVAKEALSSTPLETDTK